MDTDKVCLSCHTPLPRGSRASGRRFFTMLLPLMTIAIVLPSSGRAATTGKIDWSSIIKAGVITAVLSPVGLLLDSLLFRTKAE
jgi:hypothetical protein